MSTKQVTCRYFLHGACREGINCMFSHDLANSTPSAICRYYQKGNCSYGNSCRYFHTGIPSACSPRNVAAAPAASAPTTSSAASAPATSSAAITPAVVPKRRQKSVVLRDRDLTEDRSSGTEDRSSGAEGSDQVVKPQSYLEAIRTGLEEEAATPYAENTQQLCPYASAGTCQYGDSCVYIHGETCDICNKNVLHPSDEEQRKSHRQMCLKNFEHDMEKAFAFQDSQKKICSICMEVVYEKNHPSERRFGILTNCSHTFCLGCIRQWRGVKQFASQIVKACPECRIVSDFVIPSEYWVDDQQKKDELIAAFKQGTATKACKYFDQGRNTCPFGNNCMYLHAYPDGTIATPEQPRRQLGAEGGVRYLNRQSLWDFIQGREVTVQINNQQHLSDLLGVFVQLSTAEEDSDSSN